MCGLPLKVLVVLLVLFSCGARATEITIFDEHGTAGAYIDIAEDSTIFLWAGRPVAYLSSKSIYGFNGRHLGWIERGILRDHQGHAVGFFEGSIEKPTSLEPLKGLKGLKPLKASRELEPPRPLSSIYWSHTPLKLFLLEGAN